MVIYYLHFHPKVDSIPSCNEIATLHFIKTCCLCHSDVTKKRAPPSESQSREKFNHIVHPVAVEPVQVSFVDVFEIKSVKGEGGLGKRIFSN